jgi:hypothetical protein
MRRSTNARTEALAKAKKNWWLVSRDALAQDHNDPWADLRERTSEKALKVRVRVRVRRVRVRVKGKGKVKG